MSTRVLSVVFVCAALAPAEDRIPTGTMANQGAEITAALYNGRDAVRQVLGSDLDGYVVVVDVRVAPKSGVLAVSPDDFILRSDKDGQRSRPFAPSQIAGKGALVISERAGGAGVMGDNNGPVFGPWGRPRRLGGDGGAMGNVSETTPEATVDSGAKAKDNPMLATLKAKVFPAKESSEPVSGLLYFPLEGKHKSKQLELYYEGPAGKMSLRFRN